MTQKFRNPLAQALGLVFQNTRDKMGGISSSEIAASLGLAASHYRMIEAGSAILQPARAIKVVQVFDTIEFVPLCQALVSIQILDSVKQSIDDMRTTVQLMTEANPPLAKVLKGFDRLWDIIKTAESGYVARQLTSHGIVKDLASFLTTEPLAFGPDEIDNFMTPTYQHPISGQLYSKIGNFLQGVAPFYLDVILQLVDNLKGISPRVTPQELAEWEKKHNNRISHIIGIIRKPEIILDVNTFDYSFLWQESFHKMMIIHRNQPKTRTESIHQRISDHLRARYESERIKYERQLQDMEQVLKDKLHIDSGRHHINQIDKILLHREIEMNNLWVYIMVNGYAVIFVDNATTSDSGVTNIFGTSLAYDETCEKLIYIRELCDEIGFRL